MYLVSKHSFGYFQPFSFFSIAFFVAVTYISLDVALTFTDVFGPSNPSDSLSSIPLFVLTSIWPAAAAVLYFALMLYIVLGILNEVKPVWFFILGAVLFVLSQLDYFLLSKVICRVRSLHPFAMICCMQPYAYEREVTDIFRLTFRVQMRKSMGHSSRQFSKQQQLSFCILAGKASQKVCFFGLSHPAF